MDLHVHFSKENIKYKVHMLKSNDLNRFNFIFVSVFTENPLPYPINRLIEQKQILSQSTADQQKERKYFKVIEVV